ncbi:hypothetical protein DL95DRAFT_445655 [Leptodontidium sp. 2 PMI_412]|nr:hypothetical protein DL95DRAFT_445655 [Leptodontidium sp. 2 PMI_412]
MTGFEEFNEILGARETALRLFRLHIATFFVCPGLLTPPTALVIGCTHCSVPSQNAPIAFIKIASSQSGVESEISNQKFAFNALEALSEQKRTGIHVLKIYRVLEEASTRYIIMEYVQGQTLEELLDQDILHDLFFNQISKAIKLFLSFEVPVNATPGTIDFELAGFLPASFMTYALDQPRPSCTAIKNDFAFLPYENLEAIRVAGHNFMIRWRKAGLPLSTTILDSIPHLSTAPRSLAA